MIAFNIQVLQFKFNVLCFKFNKSRIFYSKVAITVKLPKQFGNLPVATIFFCVMNIFEKCRCFRRVFIVLRFFWFSDICKIQFTCN